MDKKTEEKTGIDPSKPYMTPEEAQQAGIDIKLRNPDGSLINPLETSSNENTWLGNLLKRSITLLTSLIDHPDPKIAIHAAESIIDRAVLLKEISQWSTPSLRFTGSRTTNPMSYDRVYEHDQTFDRGGIGDDKMFSARLSADDIKALEKIQGNENG